MARRGLIVGVLLTAVVVTAQRPIIQPLIVAPRGERIAERLPSIPTQVIDSLEKDTWKFEVTATNGKRISIEQDKDEMFLTASFKGKKLWSIEQKPTAEPADPQYATMRGWNVLAVRFGRAGMFLYDLATGKAVAEGGHDWTITTSPDRKWGLLRPYYSWAAECYVDTTFVRVAPNANSTVIETSPLVPDQICSPDRMSYGEVDAVVAPNNRIYAIVATSRTFTPDGGGGDGILELFQASDNRKLVSIRTPFPKRFTRVAFSQSSNYVVLQDAVNADQQDETQWFRINR